MYRVCAAIMLRCTGTVRSLVSCRERRFWIAIGLAGLGAGWPGGALLGQPTASPAMTNQDPPPPGIAAAQPAVNQTERPAAAGRIVRLFDFEERAFNSEAVPRFWFRAQHAPPERPRPGFPQWNKGGFDTEIFHSGTTSVKLPVAGGSCSLRLSGTVVPILPDADLEVVAVVQTKNLRHARAMISVRLLDQTGAPLPEAERFSEPILSPGSWREVSVPMAATPANAAFIQIELLAVQPDGIPGAAATDQYAVGLQDLAGAAYFDDVAIRQLPRLTIQSVSGPWIAPDAGLAGKADLLVTVRDQAGEALRATMVCSDVDGKVIATVERKLPAGGESFRWTVTLPKAGWYSAQVKITGGTAASSSTQLSLLCLQADAVAKAVPLQGDVRLGVLAENLSAVAIENLRQLCRYGGFTSVSLSAMPLLAEAPMADQSMSGQSTANLPMHQLAEVLIASGVQVGMAWNTVPSDLREKLSASELDPLGLADIESEKWFGRLEPVLDRFGRRITGWRFGKLATEQGASPPDGVAMRRRIAVIVEVLRKHAVGSRVSVPWRAEWSVTADDLFGRYVLVPASISPEAVVDRVAASAGAEMTVLQLADSSIGGRDRCIDAAQRLVSAWRGASMPGLFGTDGASVPATSTGVGNVLAFDSMWNLRTDGQIDPKPESAVMLGIGRKLLGRSVTAVIIDEPLTKALLFSPGQGSGSRTRVTDPARQRATDGQAVRDGAAEVSAAPQSAQVSSLANFDRSAARDNTPAALETEPTGRIEDTVAASPRDMSAVIVVWSEQPGAVLERHLGPSKLQAFDMFGNPVSLPAPDSSGLYRIPLTPEPLLIEGVDGELVRFVSGLRFNPSFIPAAATVQETRLSLSNPWPSRISGSVQILPSEADRRKGWSVSPAAPQSFSLSGNESGILPFNLTISPAEVVGPRSLTAVLRIEGERSYGPLKLTLPVEVGVPGLDINVVLSPSGEDLVISVTATNTGQRIRTLQINAAAQGRRQQDQSVSQLQPGESAVRRFIVENARELSGKKIMVSGIDADTSERLNKLIDVP